VFPLPDAVLLPHTTLRLHVFEPRYRALVEDLLRGDKWLAVALLDPDRPATSTPPVFHEIAGAGRIGRVSKLTGDRFHIEVEGLERVRLMETSSGRPYRLARATAYPLDAEWLERREATVALREMIGLARGLATATGAVSSVPRDGEKRLALLDQLAARAFSDHRERQRVLEALDARERAMMVRTQLRLWARMLEAVARSPRPPDPDVN
jgi:Lon protease-like protein